MDWNRNGIIDASDILTTELFEKELQESKCLENKPLDLENGEMQENEEKK